MKPVGPVIENLLRSYNLWQGYKQYRVVECWNDIVGPELSEVTSADNIRAGILRVKVKDSVWAYHLSFLKPKLIVKLNNHAGGKVVKDIFFTIEPFIKQQ